MRSRRWRVRGARARRPGREAGRRGDRLRGFSQDEPLRREAMPPGVALETLTRRASADIPPGRIVATGGAPHHDALAFEVEHGVVAAHPAQQLTDAGDRASHQAADGLRFLSCRCREPLGIVGNHICKHPLFYDARPD